MKQFDHDFDIVTKKLVLKSGSNEVLSFNEEEVPSVLGFKGTKDIACGSLLISVYIAIIEHQKLGDVRAPVVKINESERLLRNGNINTVTPVHKNSYKSLDFKPLSSNNIQNIQMKLRIDTGRRIPFTGAGKAIVSLKFRKKTFEMEAYYRNYASQSVPHFFGHYRQKGSGFGALAAGIRRFALPLAGKFLWHAVIFQ